MKFISCHISGFGKFLNQSFDLSQNLMEIKADNGWGKTTLAAFLECMLFGLDGGRVKSVNDSYRVRFAPFYGGVFGGTLVFSYRGKTYRIERTFSVTPGDDVVRVYDQNNIRCYDFGDKTERLGEILLGVDRESYKRTAYIAQGEISHEGLPSDMRGRLVALLGAGEGGAADAVERLERAERALRAKRKPAKGKLDEIDERLEQLSRMRIECENANREGENSAQLLERMNARLAQIREEISTLSARLERLQAGNTALHSRAVEERLVNTRDSLETLQYFFNGVNPLTVNVEGLENAVSEYYALQDEMDGIQTELGQDKDVAAQRESLKTALSACEKSMQSYEALAAAERKTQKAEKEKHKANKTARKKMAGTWLWFVIAVFVALFGATQADAHPALGYTLLGLGGVCLIISSIGILKDAERYAPPKKPLADSILEGELGVKYAAAKAEYERVAAQLAQLPAKSNKENGALSDLLESKRARAAALEGAIKGFLANFRYEEMVDDYAFALSLLKQRIALYDKFTAKEGEYQERLTTLAPQMMMQVSSSVDELAEISALKERLRALETEKERCIGECAALKNRVEMLETHTLSGGDYAAEEERLYKEKERLERRLSVVIKAKEILLNARRNIAAQYLEPVEKLCKKYAQTLGITGAETLLLSGEGKPVFEENGSIRQAEYYSAGTRGLLDFCLRIALAETLYREEKPVLVLDDPFAELDDVKTGQAKRLIFELAKTYQIVYFTCKTERSLRK